MPVVYADVVWLINFVMDAVLLFVTAWIVRRRVRVWRVLSGALIGSAYALLVFFPSLSTLTTWPGKALMSLAMVGLAVPCRSWLEFARTCVLFYIVTFVFAGCAIALNFAIPGVTVSSGLVLATHRLAFVTTSKSLALLVSIPLGAALVKYLLSHVKAVRTVEAQSVRVRLWVGETHAEFTGLLDTGNRLRDPVTRKPVSLVEASRVAHLLPDEMRDAALHGGDLVEALGNVADVNHVSRFRLIPYRTAGSDSLIAVAIRPDYVEVLRDKTFTRTAGDSLFALQSKPLSVDNRFEAILHMDIVTGDERFEDYGLAKHTHATEDPTAAVAHQGSPEVSERS